LIWTAEWVILTLLRIVIILVMVQGIVTDALVSILSDSHVLRFRLVINWRFILVVILVDDPSGETLWFPFR
jgi:hypothetical protein